MEGIKDVGDKLSGSMIAIGEGERRKHRKGGGESTEQVDGG